MTKKSPSARAARSARKAQARERSIANGTFVLKPRNPMIEEVRLLNARANRPIRDRRRDRHPRHRGTSSASFSGADDYFLAYFYKLPLKTK